MILYLYKSGETNFQNIINETDLYDRLVRNSVNLLLSADLIELRIDRTSYPFKKMVSLTDKGKEIAVKLRDIERILNS